MAGKCRGLEMMKCLVSHVKIWAGQCVFNEAGEETMKRRFTECWVESSTISSCGQSHVCCTKRMRTMERPMSTIEQTKRKSKQKVPKTSESEVRWDVPGADWMIESTQSGTITHNLRVFKIEREDQVFWVQNFKSREIERNREHAVVRLFQRQYTASCSLFNLLHCFFNISYRVFNFWLFVLQFVALVP
jgi:hypothetical protein